MATAHQKLLLCFLGAVLALDALIGLRILGAGAVSQRGLIAMVPGETSAALLGHAALSALAAWSAAVLASRHGSSGGERRGLAFLGIFFFSLSVLLPFFGIASVIGAAWLLSSRGPTPEALEALLPLAGHAPPELVDSSVGCVLNPLVTTMRAGVPGDVVQMIAGLGYVRAPAGCSRLLHRFEKDRDFHFQLAAQGVLNHSPIRLEHKLAGLVSGANLDAGEHVEAARLCLELCQWSGASAGDANGLCREALGHLRIAAAQGSGSCFFHLLATRAHLRLKDAEEAARSLGAFRAAGGDANTGALLECELLQIEGRWSELQARMRQTVTYDPRHLETARFWAAS